MKPRRLWPASLPCLMMLSGFAIAAGPEVQQAVTTRDNVLHVRVIDLRNSNGKVVCTLYNSADAFPSDDSKALATVSAPIQFDAGTCKFTGVQPGQYALVVFHDENNNGQFDRDELGLPKEEYGFSNDLKPEFAPPNFSQAAFNFKGGDGWITIKPAN